MACLPLPSCPGGCRRPPPPAPRPGLVRITVQKASVDTTDGSLSGGPGSCPGGHPGRPATPGHVLPGLPRYRACY